MTLSAKRKIYSFLVLLCMACPCVLAGFSVDWSDSPDRTWVGPQFWANRLQDWQVNDGRLECVDHRLAGRTVHLLTRRIGEKKGDVSLRVKLGAIDAGGVSGLSAAGFIVGAGAADLDYRAAALVQEGPGPDGGFFAGIATNGKLVIADNSKLNGWHKDIGLKGAVPTDGWKVIYADSVEGATKAENVFDGDPATIWHTEWKSKKVPYPHEVQIDMGDTLLINGFVYWPRPETQTGRVKQYEFFTSTDKLTWSGPVAKGKLANADTPEIIKFDPVKARYIRFVAVSGHLDRPACAFAELAVLDAAVVEQGFIESDEGAGDIDVGELELRLTLKPQRQSDGYELVLSAHDSVTGQKINEISRPDIDAQAIIGNIALVSNYGSVKGPGFWFNQLGVKGSKVDGFDDRLAGPVLSTQYTLSEGVLKLTAQLMPISLDDSTEAVLQVKRWFGWKDIAKAQAIVPGYTATFKVEQWDDTKDTDYRVAYDLKLTAKKTKTYYRSGTIRKDPVDKRQIVVAGFTGNHNNKRGFGTAGYKWNSESLWFPHNDIVKHVKAHKPDVLFFSGDQVYEGSSPTFADRENIQLDYMYKWYLWCWAFRDIAKDIQCITVPDDHDVYQGNLWGQGGRMAKSQNDGGYVHPADFVKMVERTQTSNLPDPYDPTLIEQGIGVYYTSMKCGQVDFAILEDRKFKIGQGSEEAESNDESKHVILGERQLAFLSEWCSDWSGGVKFKTALSQTIFGTMHTGWGSRGRGDPGTPSLDRDTNGWPVAGRNRALREIRKGFAFMLAGDQHLATTVHHGVDEYDDSGWSLCVPSIANFYPRQWTPSYRGKSHQPGLPDYTGRYLDGYGNKVTVWAVANPDGDTGKEPGDLHDKMPGYGIVKFDNVDRTITMEIWPRFTDPKDSTTGGQYPGWPKTIDMFDNYGRKAVAWLPQLNVTGMTDPVVQVIDEKSGEIVYTVRIKGNQFKPKVFAKGVYTIKVGEPETEKMRVFAGVEAVTSNNKTVDIEF